MDTFQNIGFIFALGFAIAFGWNIGLFVHSVDSLDKSDDMFHTSDNG